MLKSLRHLLHKATASPFDCRTRLTSEFGKEFGGWAWTPPHSDTTYAFVPTISTGEIVVYEMSWSPAEAIHPRTLTSMN